MLLGLLSCLCKHVVKEEKWVVIFHMNITLSVLSWEFCKVELWHDCPQLTPGKVKNKRLFTKMTQTNKRNLFKWFAVAEHRSSPI